MVKKINSKSSSTKNKVRVKSRTRKQSRKLSRKQSRKLSRKQVNKRVKDYHGGMFKGFYDTVAATAAAAGDAYARGPDIIAPIGRIATAAYDAAPPVGAEALASAALAVASDPASLVRGPRRDPMNTGFFQQAPLPPRAYSVAAATAASAAEEAVEAAEVAVAAAAEAAEAAEVAEASSSLSLSLRPLPPIPLRPPLPTRPSRPLQATAPDIQSFGLTRPYRYYTYDPKYFDAIRAAYDPANEEDLSTLLPPTRKRTQRPLIKYDYSDSKSEPEPENEETIQEILRSEQLRKQEAEAQLQEDMTSIYNRLEDNPKAQDAFVRLNDYPETPEKYEARQQMIQDLEDMEAAEAPDDLEYLLNATGLEAASYVPSRLAKGAAYYGNALGNAGLNSWRSGQYNLGAVPVPRAARSTVEQAAGLDEVRLLGLEGDMVNVIPTFRALSGTDYLGGEPEAENALAAVRQSPTPITTAQDAIRREQEAKAIAQGFPSQSPSPQSRKNFTQKAKAKFRRG